MSHDIIRPNQPVPIASDPREIAPGVWWMTQCLMQNFADGVVHVHNAPYLIVGSKGTLLWDTAPPTSWATVEAHLDRLLGDRQLDYVVPSHPEVAHCGNVHRLMEKYPEAKLVGDIRDHPFYFPKYADRMEEYRAGSEIDLGGPRFVFLDAIIKDLRTSQWGYEATQGVMFVGDGFAYSHQPPMDDDDRPTHRPGECTWLASELGEPPGAEQIVWITKAALYWTRFVKLDRYFERFQELRKQYPTKLIAPAHGAVIDDVDKLATTIWDALRLAYDPELGAKTAGRSLYE